MSKIGNIWKDFPSTDSPFIADPLNDMCDAIDDNDGRITTLEVKEVSHESKFQTIETSLNAAEDDIDTLQDNVSNIRVYVGEDEALHFVDKDGADAALPFSSGSQIYDIGQTLDVKAKLPDIYSQLTKDNIIIVPKAIGYEKKAMEGRGGTQIQYLYLVSVDNQPNISFEYSYDSTTGKITLSSTANVNQPLWFGWGDNQWGGTAGSYNGATSFSYNVYVVVGEIEKI